MSRILQDRFGLAGRERIALLEAGKKHELSKERVRGIGGTLRVESAPGKGTTIHVAVPTAQSPLIFLDKPQKVML